jgi:hypothetical protein
LRDEWSNVVDNHGANVLTSEQKGDPTMPHRLRLVTPAVPELTVAETKLIDTHATSDAHADYAAGDDHLHVLMETLFLGGHLSRPAWERYAAVYEREAFSLHKQVENGG